MFDQEPPPPDNPLFALKNVVLTSHFAGPTWDNQIARLRNAYDNVQRVARGEPPLWVVPELSDLVMQEVTAPAKLALLAGTSSLPPYFANLRKL